MATSNTLWLVTLLVAGIMLVVPLIAWIAWLRHRARPRPLTLLVVALVASAPIATALAGAVWCVVTLLGRGDSDAEPYGKARRLAEAIAETMNLTAFVTLAAVSVCAVTLVASWWTSRRRAP
jgi:hypothetical protein